MTAEILVNSTATFGQFRIVGSGNGDLWKSTGVLLDSRYNAALNTQYGTCCEGGRDPMLVRITLIVLTFLLVLSSGDAGAKRPNVLFIAADDLRSDLGCLGHPLVKTPNIDRLAGRGVTFQRAYCQQALCNPSRSSLLTGRRPDTLRLWNLTKHFRDQLPDVVTLPQYFMQQGYHAQNIGKIFHNWRTEIEGDPDSWSVPAVMHYATHGADKPEVPQPLPPNLASDPKCECRDVPDEAYYDGRIAKMAVEAIGARRGSDVPFFLAVGFWKPHSPFNAPKRYWDLYDRQQVPLPSNVDWPKDAPRIAWHNGRELLGTPARELSEEAVREIHHGYLAAISYLDAQVGKLLDELDRTGMADNTLIVFWSDHGYHLGEHTLWAKTSNFELDARVPLIIALPDRTSAGRKTMAITELLDLYPTLVEACGLPRRDDLQGVSLMPVLRDPSTSVKDAAITQHPRPAYYKQTIDAMGHSIRTTRFRYTEWRSPSTEKLLGRELYDHRRDPQESANVVAEEEFAPMVKELASRLKRIRQAKGG